MPITQSLPLSLYVHLPWCLRKCPYCDFNAHAHTNPPFASYTEALIKDLRANWQPWHGRQLLSIFFGGGTPSLFPPEYIARIIAAVHELFRLEAKVEITLEANPALSDRDHFAQLRAAGVNRLSLGIQSFADTSLTALGRSHASADSHQAIAAARAAGFANINLDLMYALPHQRPQMALDDLRQALDYQPEHISWYQLNIEPNTIFYSRQPQLPDDDSIAQIERAGQQLLQQKGWQRYEVSAYARRDRACQHNLNYWRFGDYIGIGAGAHSKLTLEGRIWREQRVRLPASYIANPQAGPVRTLTASELPLEFMLNALRLISGVAASSFPRYTGLELSSIAAAVKDARAAGLLRNNPKRLQPTARGLNFLNDTLAFFNE